MTCKINCDTSDGLKLTSDTSGIVEIQNNGTTIITSSQPLFSASMNGDQSVSAETFTKVEFDTEIYDTNSAYDTSIYRFTPGVAGYYQFNLAIRGSSDTLAIVALYKNGSAFKRKVVGGHKYAALSIICESNATDYFEAFGYTTGTTFANSANDNYFQAHYIRSA
jgi:hypothetical protein